MSQQTPVDGRALRLHLNEHTGGCSPLVVDALMRLSAEDFGRYPDYDTVNAACARHLGIPPDHVLLTNGLDDGILLACLACIAPASSGADAIVLEPAFEMYARLVELAGGRTVAVPPHANFEFPLDAVRQAISSDTRLLFLTNPNNPTGLCIDRKDIRALTRALPDGAYLFLDEAYAEFARTSFIDEVQLYSNVIVGRTFAKAYGLAALRIGAIVAPPAIIDRLRRLAPPYNLNVCAAVALEAALTDHEHVERYIVESNRSKQLLYAACGRLGLQYWHSEANFILVRANHLAGRIVEGLAARGILIRDKSSAPGCTGCIRITAGRVEDTRACIAALEEVLCDEP